MDILFIIYRLQAFINIIKVSDFIAISVHAGVARKILNFAILPNEPETWEKTLVQK